jgi:hypothetical protein
MISLRGILFSGAVTLATSLTPVVAHSQDSGSNGLAERAAPQAAETGECNAQRVSFTASTLTNSATTSTSFVDVPEGSVSFTQHGTSSDCVVVYFTAQSFAPASRGLLMVRAVLDGGTVLSPGQQQFSGDDDEDFDGRWARSHAFSWAVNNVAPGAHKIQIQFRSFYGDKVFVHQHTTTVHHR